MVYSTDIIKTSGTSMPYVPTPLGLPTSIADKSSSAINEQQTNMTNEQEEEDFIKNNYVARTLLNEPELPPITLKNWYKEVNWPQATLLCLEPFVALYGLFTTGFMCKQLFLPLYGIS
jgi:hypothetical protein